MAKKPKPGSRMSQARVDAAARGRDAKAAGLKRTETDKATGSKVYKTSEYNAYVKADRAAGKARIEHLTPKQRAAMKAKK